MKNRALFVLDPVENKLLNDGVAEINTNKNEEDGQRIIRYELKTFVCEGEYERGLYRILSTYLKYVNAPMQPAVWVSGFFGSGKSHLVKMLGYFWENYTFPSGETARNIKQLPDSIHDALVELDRYQSRYGSLSVAGTLKDFPSTDIRYSFFQLFLDALGLPPLYHHFKFVHWLKKEGIYDDLKAYIESEGKNFKKEYENLFVSTLIAKGILQLKPGFADSEAQVRDYLRLNFNRVETISRDQLLSTIKDEVLPLFYDDIPCTIIVLDEVQQFIGSDGNKTIEVQNLAQDISNNFGGKFLLVATGQNALSDTPYLQPLNDRFSVKVMLSDQDVETVTRKTVLEKKPSAVADIRKMMEKASGEIARNLQNTAFAYESSDEAVLAADYPILPSTRKFWKKVLQVIDTAGTQGQLRSQLRIIDDSVKQVAEQTQGRVVAADFIYEQKEQQLLQNARLLNDTYNLIVRKKAGDDRKKLQGRILSVAFLIDQLPADLPGGRPRSDKQTIADLLIDDLSNSSDRFRLQVAQAIDALVDEKLLMPIGDEFKLQTKAGQEWEQEYTAQVQKLINQGDDKIQAERTNRILSHFKELVKKIRLVQGEAKVPRDIHIHHGDQKPSTDNNINLWIRDGWIENDKLVLAEIREAGTSEALSYAFVKKQRDQDLKNEIIKFLAAKQTLELKGMPSDQEGQQAQKSMETRFQKAEEAIGELIARITADAEIYLAGGTSVREGALRETVEKALNQLLNRQFPEFSKGDHQNWSQALRAALQKNPSPLEKIGFQKDLIDHPVATEVMRFLANDTCSGRELRGNFTKSPYGWPQDAIDTAIIALVNAEYLSTAEQGLTQARIGVAKFKKELHTLSAGDKIKLRKLYAEFGIKCDPGKEFLHSAALLQSLMRLAETISGDSPKPEPINVQFLKDIEFKDGNDRLQTLVQQASDLKEKFKDWSAKAVLVRHRLPNWQLLLQLLDFAPDDSLSEIVTETEAIKHDRLLLAQPDPVSPLLQQTADSLKKQLSRVKQQYIDRYDRRMAQLQKDVYFSRLTPEQKHPILRQHQLLAKPEIKDYSPEELLNSLKRSSLENWRTKIAALPSQFDNAAVDAAQLLEPKAESYSLRRTTLNTKEDIEHYVTELKTELEELLAKAKSIILK